MKNFDTSHPKFKRMMYLFGKTNKIGYRHNYAYKVSGGRTESTKELTEIEVEKVIAELEKLNVAPINLPKGDKQRKKMIAIAGKMNWGNNSKSLVFALNNWCLKQKFAKPLMKHDEKELNTLLYILENKVYPSFLKAVNK